MIHTSPKTSTPLISATESASVSASLLRPRSIGQMDVHLDSAQTLPKDSGEDGFYMDFAKELPAVNIWQWAFLTPPRP